MQSQTFADEVDAGEAEKSIQNVSLDYQDQQSQHPQEQTCHQHAKYVQSYYHFVDILLLSGIFSSLRRPFGCDEHRDCYVGDNSQDPISNCTLINPRNTSVILLSVTILIVVNGLASVGGINICGQLVDLD